MVVILENPKFSLKWLAEGLQRIMDVIGCKAKDATPLTLCLMASSSLKVMPLSYLSETEKEFFHAYSQDEIWYPHLLIAQYCVITSFVSLS